MAKSNIDKLIVIGDRVLIEPAVATHKTKGGLLLPAGYQPVMQGNTWSWPELEHDAASCLKLCMEEVLWTLEGFFGGSGRTSRPAAPDTPRTAPRT